MTSSRDSPFSFSPDLRLSLGAPDALNVSLRFAFPGLFSRDYGPTRAVAQFSDDRSGPRLEVRPGASIPAGSLVGLFSGHLFVGAGVRGTSTISIPPGAAVPGALHLAVDGAARSSRFPSAVEAALYGFVRDCHGHGLVVARRPGALPHRTRVSCSSPRGSSHLGPRRLLFGRLHVVPRGGAGLAAGWQPRRALQLQRATGLSP